MRTKLNLMLLSLCALAPLGARAEVVKIGKLSPAQKTAPVVVGDVKIILDGQSTGSKVLRVEPQTFGAALGAASLTSDPAGQGETLVVGNRTFVKSVDENRQYETTSSLRGFWTGFAAGIPQDARPVARYNVGETSETVESLYRRLAQDHGPLFAVVGLAHFGRLEASAVKRAPCWGEPILGDQKSRYFHPPAVHENVDALFFGLALRSAQDSTSTTQRIFYINPDDRGSTGVLSHSHFATLRGTSGIQLDNFNSAARQVGEVAHLLTQSTMTSGTVVVYELETTHTARSKFPINEEGKVVTPSTTYFLEHREKFRREAPSIEPGTVVLLGDSLTAKFPMEKLPKGVRAVNRGIGGDKVGGWKFYGVLDRLDCCVEALKPGKLFLMIGVNDIISANTPEAEMTSGTRTLLARLKELVPPDRIYVQSVLPVSRKFTDKNPKVDKFNKTLRAETEAIGAHFINLHPLFEDTEGKLSDEVTSDGVHLNAAGYDRWLETIRPLL